MEEQQLNNKVMDLMSQARELGYTLTKPTVFVDEVHGKKLAYYQHSSNKIVMHEHFTENATAEEVILTLIHEFAHAVAEQNNDSKKRVWHGQAWKDICTALGGDAERYHTGDYKKPDFKKMSKQDLYKIQPKHPADRWERGTYNQWLRRGYHVMKGQKGFVHQWEFVADEYETEIDGKTSNYGRGTAVYFTPEQVEPNEVAQ